MEKFRKVEIVEARRYDGPRLTVVHDELGEQTAVKGDYLLGSERGKIRVMPAAKFEAEYEPYDEAAEAEKVLEQQKKAAQLEEMLAQQARGK